MLINCPRCGFSQPQDQYCAQCGIDMQKFKPKKKPLLNQIFSSTVFQVGILLVALFFIGQYLLSRPAPQKFVQRIFRSQGVTKSKSSLQNANSESSSAADDDQVKNEIITENAGQRNFVSAGNAAAMSSAKTTAETTAPNLKLIYIEVPTDTLNKWISESSSAGLYQSLPDYAVGILTDFHKHSEPYQILKSAELKILTGSSNTNISGVMNEDGTQLIGLSSNVELKSIENETLQGSISVTKSSRQGNENFPSEYELPKGSAFFIIGTLKVENFLLERPKLQMPPFQIFKSPDFLTRKSEFVIILEPIYK